MSQSVYRYVMALCLKQKLESANRFIPQRQSTCLNYYPWIWGIFPHTLKFHYVQHIILELCRPLSKQFHAPHHAFDDTAFNAHLVRLTQKVILTIPCFASLQFDAHVRNIANLDFSIYWSFMISAGLELPADLLSIVGLEQLGRYV